MAKRSPATTPTMREQQLIAKAVDLAEQQIEDGTVSAQVLTHYIKMGSTREALEQEMIGLRNTHLQAQTEALAAQGRIEELIGSALDAFKRYAGGASSEISYDSPEELL